MAKRIKLGLVFKYDESWVAGSYYILNLMQALKTLDEVNQPEIILFTDREEDKIKVQTIAYPFLTHKKYTPRLNFVSKLINTFSRMLFNKNRIEKRMQNKDVDYIFMQRRSWETDLIANSKKIFWIPDCQELMMPELFFERELTGRKHVYNEIITARSKILFSSNAALNDFTQHYPKAMNEMYVVNFAVTHPDFSHIKFEDLLLKYSIEKKYFIVPNQFWVHKNHKVVLEAARILKNQKKAFQILFTGKENDFRAPEYTSELKQYVIEHNLSDVVKFLGFIPREEQLRLMKNSVAIIQPSLFEGWSTVVEDAKALNKWILLSDIAVHREQINKNVDFFNPGQASELAEVMMVYEKNNVTSSYIDYQQNIINFGKGFSKMLS